MEVKKASEWREKIEIVLQSKVKEFEMLGYKGISAEDIWTCLMDHIWKEDKLLRLHELVQSIFHLQVHTYMDYVSLDSIQTLTKESEEDLVASIQAVMHHDS